MILRFLHLFRNESLALVTVTRYNALHNAFFWTLPAANGLAEAFNKIIIKLLKKFISSSKRDCNEKLSECLWAYQTTVRTATSNTPFSLVYGYEAVIPLEIQMSSLQVTLATKMTKEDNDSLRLQELNALDEKRLQAQKHMELYQARISKAFNKKVK